jgi:hypothetical protein
VSPLRVTGLLQHEAKLSVVNFSVKTAVTYGAPLANKEELLLVTGTRSFRAQPVWSADEHGADKYKMLRWVQPGQQVVGSIYAPIMYAPQPVLAFKVGGRGGRNGYGGLHIMAARADGCERCRVAAVWFGCREAAGKAGAQGGRNLQQAARGWWCTQVYTQVPAKCHHCTALHCTCSPPLSPMLLCAAMHGSVSTMCVCSPMGPFVCRCRRVLSRAWQQRVRCVGPTLIGWS